jgi:hypothetical protein
MSADFRQVVEKWDRYFVENRGTGGAGGRSARKWFVFSEGLVWRGCGRR